MLLTWRTQSDQTANGDYEKIVHWRFKGIADERIMSWKGGEGFFSTTKGVDKLTNTDNLEGMKLDAWEGVTVSNTILKLKKA